MGWLTGRHVLRESINRASKGIAMKKSVIISALFILSIFASVSGQSNHRISQGNTHSNFQPGTPAGSYALSGFESINPYSGKVNFSLPLFKVAGRGNAGYSVDLTIQRNWLIKHDVNDPNLYGFPSAERYAINHTYTPSDADEAVSTYGANFTPGFLGFMKGRRTGTNRNSRICGNSQPCYDETLTRLSFTQTDGTEIEFRDVANGGRAYLFTSAAIQHSRGTHWVSTDGTNATFISNSVIYDYREKAVVGDGILFPSGTLYLQNGTKYVIQDGNVISITDVNGNQVTPGEDSLGREITKTIISNPEPGVDRATVFNFKGTGGTARTTKINYSLLEDRLSSGYSITGLWSLFELIEPEGQSGVEYNPEVVSSVVLPDGRTYQFRYNNYGELTEILLPTGGKIEYVWQSSHGRYGIPEDPQVLPSLGAPPPDDAENLRVYRRVEKRRVYESNELITETIYGVPGIFNQYDSTVTVENYAKHGGSLVLNNKIKHYYFGWPVPSFIGLVPLRPTEDPNYLDGKEFKSEVYDASGTLLRKTENTWEAGTPIAANPLAPVNARVAQVTETLSDANLISKKTFSYDSFNNQTDVYEYDYGTGAPGQFLRRSHTDYVTDANYTSHTGAHLRSLPIQSWVSADISGNTKASLTQFEYDNYITDAGHAALISRSNVVGHDTTNYGTSNIRRGNVTAVTSYADAQAQTGAITAYSQFDILGNVVKAIDAKGCASTINYDDNFGAPDGEAQTNTPPSQLNGLNTFAFPKSATNCMGWVTGYSQVDYFTGASVNTEDINGVISKTIYNDPLDRPTQSVSAIGTAHERQSNVIYDDANRRIETKSDLFALNDNLIKSESFYDGLGRTFESRSYKDGGYIVSKSEFDALGRVKRVTNPYRPHLSEQVLWTESFYDALGRVTKIKTPDTAEALTSYSGNTITVTDQAGKQRRSITNALGQLIRVDEPNAAGQLGTVASPNQPTFYTYNTLGKMVEVNQGVQNRYFMYDSLGRLLRVRQPEQEGNTSLNTSGNPANNSWSTGFTYDNNGNVLTATDAKNTIITNTFDDLNRVMTRAYSDGTPAVLYTYDDPNVPFSKGKLTRTSNSVSTSQTTEYDRLGRGLSYQQITDGQTYTSSYKYDLSGALIEETYPSGRVVKNFLETDGDLASVSSRVANGDFKTFVSDFSYTSAGGISALRYGNGRWETAKFNARQQIEEIGLGTNPTNKSLWSVVYSYGQLNTDGVTVDASKNDGNIAKQTMSSDGLANPFIQTYKYDPLNRLVEAKEKNNGSQTWLQTFGYDQYGNRTAFAQNILGQQLALNNLTHPSIDENSNRFSIGQGYTYDPNGNLTVNAYGEQFTFNGDNKQTEVRDGSNNLIGNYFYDGDGKRVKKITSSETIIFVYSGGKLIAEYSMVGPPQNPNTHYTTADYLGSPRVITDRVGNVVSRRDFMPFGEDISPDTTYRAASSKYGANDTIRQRFTGYQKDNETGLDFAEARMYQNQHARFTAIDPLLASGKSDNPQTFNRFVYAGNNPILRSDPTGEDWIIQVVKGNVGKQEVDVKVPLWVPKGEIPSDIPRAPNIWETNYGEKGFLALHPTENKTSEVFKTRDEAQAWLNNNVGDERVMALVNSVYTNPKFQALDRITNPDGITVSGQLPLIGTGGSLTLTRNFDVVGSFSQGRNFAEFKDLATAKGLGDIVNKGSLLGGFSVQASVITESDVTRSSRLGFFTGGSATVGGCVRVCAGTTFVPQSDGTFRQSLNLGVSPVSVPSGGLTVNYAPQSFVFNPHRRFFGPTSQTNDR